MGKRLLAIEKNCNSRQASKGCFLSPVSKTNAKQWTVMCEGIKIWNYHQ